MTSCEKMNVTFAHERKLRPDDIQRLQQLWDVGIASGPAGELDMKKLRCDARKRLQSAKALRA
jgi:antitoxin ParD1/3/4